MYLVLLVLIISGLAQSHLEKTGNYEFVLDSISWILLPIIIIAVSSAYIKSFIYKEKNKGPRTDPVELQFV